MIWPPLICEIRNVYQRLIYVRGPHTARTARQDKSSLMTEPVTLYFKRFLLKLRVSEKLQFIEIQYSTPYHPAMPACNTVETDTAPLPLPLPLPSTRVKWGGGFEDQPGQLLIPPDYLFVMTR